MAHNGLRFCPLFQLKEKSVSAHDFVECPFKLWTVNMPLCQQQKRKLRLYISNTFNPARPDADDSDGSIASWELRVEGKLLDDVSFHFICTYQLFFYMHYFKIFLGH